MSRTLMFSLLGTALILAPIAAFGAHGKAGLWTITSSTKLANMPQMQNLPPEAMAMMKARGMQMPGMGQPMVSQICMTQDEVNADHPPAMREAGQSCTTKVLSQTANSVNTEITCHGRVEGTGRAQVSWRGTDHYEGTYNFKGTMEGQVQEISTSYSGDFVKADCGNVKPFGPPPGR